ncbi:MAG TPA: hypothetical protein PLN21_15400 [Gemmatales bacterium]|nr:hypothetical protein [Gemmatales bacterium]
MNPGRMERVMKNRKRRVRKNSPIAENIIHTWVGEAQFNRGMQYVQQGLVHYTFRRGYEITAFCDGRTDSNQRYQVRATVVEGKIEEAFCTCSIGKHGVCPHIAAMLVTYSRQPELFKEISLLNWFKGLLGMNR